MSNIFEDLKAAFSFILNERWICKKCAATIYRDPTRLATGWYRVRPCPNCGSTEWYHTGTPSPKV